MIPIPWLGVRAYDKTIFRLLPLFWKKKLKEAYEITFLSVCVSESVHLSGYPPSNFCYEVYEITFLSVCPLNSGGFLRGPYRIKGSQDSVVGIATCYGLDDRGVGVPVPEGSRMSLLHVVQTGSGAHPASYPWVPGALSPRIKLTTHLQLVPRSRKCGSICRLPHMPSWRSA
jgi:hypothetical protein